jgi:hypothetical protein
VVEKFSDGAVAFSTFNSKISHLFDKSLSLGVGGAPINSPYLKNEAVGISYMAQLRSAHTIRDGRLKV